MSTNDDRSSLSPQRRLSSAKTNTGPLTFIQLQASYLTSIRELTRSARRLRVQQHNVVTVRRTYQDDTEDYI